MRWINISRCCLVNEDLKMLINIEKEKFMLLLLDQHIFKIMFEIKSNSLEPILKHYGVDQKNLYDL